MDGLRVTEHTLLAEQREEALASAGHAALLTLHGAAVVYHLLRRRTGYATIHALAVAFDAVSLVRHVRGLK